MGRGDERPRLPRALTKKWLAGLSDEDLLAVDRELWRTPDHLLRGTPLLRLLEARRLRVTEELERRGLVDFRY